MSALPIARRTAAIVFLAIVSACGAGPTAVPPRTTPRPSSPSSSTSPAQSTAKALLYPDAKGLWLYSFGEAQPLRVAAAEPETWGWGFSLKTANEAAYFYRGKAYEFDARDRVSHALFTAPGGFAMAWSPDRQTLAYMTVDHEKDGSNATAYLRIPGEEPRRLWASRRWAGRGIGQLDEVSIAWSPDGTRILIVATPLDTAIQGDTIVTSETIFVLRTDGSAVVKPRFGTMARWSADGTSIYYRSLGAAGVWRDLRLADQKESPLALPPDAYRPATSPDGTMIAFDDGKQHPSLFVFDRTAGTTRLIAKDHVAPIWLSATSLAAGKTTACEGTENRSCDFAPWWPGSTTTRFDVGSAEASAQPLPIGSIALGADVAYV